MAIDVGIFHISLSDLASVLKKISIKTFTSKENVYLVYCVFRMLSRRGSIYLYAYTCEVIT